MNSIICNAIDNKEVLEFCYHGENRVIEPFCYGVSTSGNEVLRAFQISGYSDSGKSFGWKMFKVNEMKYIHDKGLKFNGKREHYNPNDKNMVEIFRRI